LASVPPGAVADVAAGRTVGGVHLLFRQVFRAGLPYDNTVVSVEATSTSDAWAVGESDAAGEGDHRSYAVHWNGRSWKMVHLPARGFVPDSVRASSRHDVWVLGNAWVSGNAADPEALRWDGTRWHVVAVPSGAGTFRPVVLGPSDVWLTGPVTWAGQHGWRSVTWHWNGRAWASYTLPVLSDFSLEFGLAGSSARNMWAVGTAASGPHRHEVGRLVAYRWTGSAWHRAKLPRVYLTGSPQIAVGASGEEWIAGRGAYRMRGRPVVLYRRHGKWSRLSNRVLDMAIDAVADPVPDGLDGVWFEFGLYWSGRAAVAIPGPPGTCRSMYYEGQSSFMDGVPGTHAVLTGAGCQLSVHGRIEGSISVTRPVGSRGLS
jgi:hypothetical protein